MGFWVGVLGGVGLRGGLGGFWHEGQKPTKKKKTRDSLSERVSEVGPVHICIDSFHHPRNLIHGFGFLGRRLMALESLEGVSNSTQFTILPSQVFSVI